MASVLSAELLGRPTTWFDATLITAVTASVATVPLLWYCPRRDPVAYLAIGLPMPWFLVTHGWSHGVIDEIASIWTLSIWRLRPTSRPTVCVIIINVDHFLRIIARHIIWVSHCYFRAVIRHFGQSSSNQSFYGISIINTVTQRQFVAEASWYVMGN